MDFGDATLPNQFVDQDVVNGKTYIYHLTALIGETLDDIVVESPASESVVVTPGPEVCWVLDEGLGELIKVSTDARAVSTRVVSIFGASHLALDPRDGACWTATRFGGLEQQGVAIRFSPQGEQVAVVSGLSSPSAVAVDPRDGAAWIVDSGVEIGEASEIIRVSDIGGLQLRLTGFVDPVALAVDPNTGNCWIADIGTGSVTQVDFMGNVRFTIGNVGQPVALAVDPGTGECWGIDNSAHQIFKLQTDGTRTVTVTGLTNPVRLACSPVDGTCWIVDQEGQTVILLRMSVPDGYDITQRKDFHSSVSGLISPSDVSIDVVTGNAWVSDPGQNILAKLTLDGRLIRQFGLISPIAVVVDPEPRQVTVIP